MNLLDLIFPKTCINCGRVGEYLCLSCQDKVERVSIQICPVCTRASISGLTHPRCKTKLNLDGLHSLVYFSSPVPQALYQLKYKFAREFAKDLINKLDKVGLGQFQNYYLISGPLYKKRQNWRGFNQVEILAELISTKFGVKYEKGILARKKPTSSQVGLSRKSRMENVRGAFECTDKNFVAGKKLLLFDDVWTSGATLKNAGMVLKRAGAEEVWGLTLARSR